MGWMPVRKRVTLVAPTTTLGQDYGVERSSVDVGGGVEKGGNTAAEMRAKTSYQSDLIIPHHLD